MDSSQKLISSLSIKYLFSKPNTISHKDKELDSCYNGRLFFRNTSCNGCSVCTDVCPSLAIQINNAQSSDRNDYVCQWDMGRCIFCSQCVVSCPRSCLQHLSDAKMAVLSKDELEQLL